MRENRERKIEKKEMLKKVEELRLELIHLQFTDIAGYGRV